MFTAPTAIRAIKREDAAGSLAERYDLGTLRALFLAGERTDPPTLEWAKRALGVPILDHWWQTETGWPITGNLFGLKDDQVKVGSAGRPIPGMRISVVDQHGRAAGASEMGSLVVELPMPPGVFLGLWNAEERCFDAYFRAFPGYYKTGDAGWMDADGYVFVMSRTDDDINVAGHRLSTGAMEEVLTGHEDVAECAVIGVNDALKGQLPIGFVVLNSGSETPPQRIVAECVDLVRDRIGPVASFKTAVVVNRLPKTRSGKILRGVMRSIANGEPWKTPATIDDAAILDEIVTCLASVGYPE
jgi:propionyl-CoA synthetase